MEQNTLDDQLKNYFQHHKKEIKDEAFTKRVMQQLPRRDKHIYIIYLFAFMGLITLVLFNGYDQLMVRFNDFSLTIPKLKMPLAQSLSILIGFLAVVISIAFIGIDKEDNVLSI